MALLLREYLEPLLTPVHVGIAAVRWLSVFEQDHVDKSDEDGGRTMSPSLSRLRIHIWSAE